MKALIFAAGKGVRMLPLTADKPKPLLEVLGKPLLAHIIEALPDAVTEIILVVGYKGEMIKARFGDAYAGRTISYVEQEEQLGTGNALWACRSHIAAGERFMIIYADDIYGRDDLALLLKHPRTFLVAPVEHPERFGIVLTDAAGRIADFEEKPAHPKSNLGWTGAMLIDADVFNYPPSMDPANKEEIIQTLVVPYMRDREIFAETVKFWLPIGYPEDIAKAETALEALTASGA